jgi:AraC family transcriptional regulator, transcriptional activator of pobA
LHPGYGGVPLISSHLLLLCFQLWRLSASRGGGPALIGNFLQMVELHARSGVSYAAWP